MMTERFNKEAAEWDNNQDIRLINATIADQVLPGLLSKEDTVLELGCGTGLLTFLACERVSEWLGVDTAQGMIDMFHDKLKKHDIENHFSPGRSGGVHAMCTYLESPTQLNKMYDWAVSSMTFHHIPEMQPTITCLASCIKKGLIIVDYLEFDGSRVFHPEEKMDGVERHGLSMDEMKEMCHHAGFRQVHTEIGFRLTLSREGKEVNFPFLVVIARH